MNTIHRNNLGTPEPNATIFPTETRVKGQYVPAITGYHVASVIVGLDSPKFCTWEAATEWAKTNGFDVAPELDGYNHKRARLTHRATASYLARCKAAHEAKWADATRCYVRYGDLPKGGRSVNHADGTAESGVSVYNGLYLPTTGEAIAIPTTNAEACGMLTISDRPLYIVDGEEVGRGSDGEPVVRNARIVTRAN